MASQFHCCEKLGPRVAARYPLRLAACVGLLCLFSACLARAAQQNVPHAADWSGSASVPPATAPTPQEPGSDTQLRTGTNSGLDADGRIANLLADHEFQQIEAMLSQLPADQAQMYRGILANRSNDLVHSIALLQPLLDRIAADGNANHEKLARMALAEDYLRLGDWDKAQQAYQLLDARLRDKLSADELAQMEMPLRLLPLARDNPRVVVDACEPFKLQVSEDPLGLIDVPVFVDARSHDWMLDPTAPFTLIARSVAKDAGLDVSLASATITTLTGRPIQMHATVIPRLTIGGRMTLHNVTAFVFDDKDYYFPQTHYQVEGVLGYVALAALGAVTIASDNTIQVRPANELDPGAGDDRLNSGARFYIDGDQIVVAFGNPRKPVSASRFNDPPSPAQNSSQAAPGVDDDRMFVVDAGGQQTYLTSRYFDEHAADFNDQKMEMFSILGTQYPPQPAYVAERVPLRIGNSTVELHFMHVLTQPLGSAALDDVYGVLGVDALNQLKSYTFDYRTMRFAVESEP